MKKKNSQSKIENSQSQLVWRIFHFAERFELPEDIKICRKSGLQYTKRFVGIAGGDEAVGYHSQLALLENGDGMESCLIEGIYGRLVNMAAQHSYAKRGYLIDAADQPLSDAQIGKLLNINRRTMGRYMRLFESVRLIEKAELPEFDLTKNEIPENSGKFRKPLKKGKRQNKKKKVNEQKATNGHTAVEDKEKNNGNRKRKSKAQGKVGVEPPSAPTAAPEPSAVEPSESDAPGGVKAQAGCKSPRSPVSARPGRKRPDTCISDARYDKSDVIYAGRIYEALKLRHPRDSPEAWREITSFAAVWNRCRSRLAALPLEPEELDRLGLRGLRQAAKIAKQKKGNRGAIFNDFMDTLTESIISKGN